MRRRPAHSVTTPGDGPLLQVGADGLTRLTRGPHKGKMLSALSAKTLDALMKQSYPHASDPEMLLAEFLTRLFKKPVTPKTALAAMREEWALAREKMEKITGQPSLSDKLLAGIAGKLSEAAETAGE